jgi:hypothetical protein
MYKNHLRNAAVTVAVILLLAKLALSFDSEGTVSAASGLCLFKQWRRTSLSIQVCHPILCQA